MSCRFNEFSDRIVRQATQIQSLFEQGRGEEAIGVLLAEIGPVYGVPRHAPRVFTFGTRLLKAGDLQKALSYFDNVLSPNDHCDWGLYGRALAHRLLGQDAQAEADLARAIAIAETHQQARRFDPVALLQLAACGLEDLAALFPDDAQAHALHVLLQGHLQERQP